MADLETVNHYLQLVSEHLGNDVGALIGEPLEFAPMAGEILSAPDFLQKLTGRLAMAKMTVSGSNSGTSFLITGVKTAIILGGKLIMLPPEELNTRLASQNIDGELADSFEEISNIVTGSLNSVFQEEAADKLHFKKIEVKQESAPKGPAPALADLSESRYYVFSAAVKADGKDLGPFWLLLPPALLGLAVPESAATAATEAAAAGAGGGKSLLVLIAAEEPQEGKRIAALLGQNSFQTVQLDLKGDLRKALQQQQVGGVLLVLREVGESGFAAAIKLKSAIPATTPLLVAGPEWTRKTVLQAVKYGACDILISPVEEKELCGKLREHLKTGQ